MLNAGVDPNSPYSAISFDTMMLAALTIQHQAHNNIAKEDLSKSLVSVANPPGIKMGPGSWELLELYFFVVLKLIMRVFLDR